MYGIFINDDDNVFFNKSIGSIILELKEAGYNQVFINGSKNLYHWVKACHNQGLKIHLVIDCFSHTDLFDKEALENRYLSTINQITYALARNVDGVCLDAIRSWKPTLKRRRASRLIASMIASFKEYAGDVALSVCVKGEWYGTYGTMKWLAKFYGQDYELMAPHVDIFLPMAYRSLYSSKWGLKK